MQKLIIWICFLIIYICNPIASAVQFQVSGSLPPIGNTFISGTHPAVVGIYKGTSSTPIWSEPISAITFRNGAFSIIIGKVTPLQSNQLSTTNAHIGIRLTDISHQTQYIKLTSVPYAFKATIAEQARRVSANTITGTIIVTTNIDSAIVVRTSSQNYSLFINSSNVGIGKNIPTSKLDVAGIINASEGFKIRGTDITGALSWKPNSVITQNIFFNTGRVGIGTSAPNPRYSTDVNGTINATEYFSNGRKISATLDWQRSTVASDNLYFINLDKRVGIGINNPRHPLHVLNEIRVSTNINPGSPGMIRRSPLTNEIEGFTQSQGWTGLTGLRGSGRKDTITYFSTPKGVSNSPLFIRNNVTNMVGIGIASPNHTLHIKETNTNTSKHLFHVTSTRNKTLLTVGITGNVGIGTPTPGQKLKVVGSIAADDITLNGLSILLAVSKDSVWLLNASHNVYYTLGNVGIGQNRPESLLEIAQPTNSDKDPALTISNGQRVSYTMGVDNDNPDTFKVEFGTTLGSRSPLFVAKNNFLGIGLETPLAPLHVRGNLGAVFSGTFFGVPEETQLELDPSTGDKLIPVLPAEGPGTRFLWQPQRSILRAGHIDISSPLRGKDWDDINSGKFSNVFGYNSLASGNFVTVTGGKGNIGSGAYSTVVGGENNIAEGDFTLVLGRNITALHEGSFVFNDSAAIPTSTTRHSQFLIMASRGVGIGTNTTTVDGIRSSLVVRRNNQDGNLLRFTGISTANNSVVLNSSGNMVIGSTIPGTSKLSVMGPMTIGGIPRNPSGNIIHANTKLSVNQDTSANYIVFIKSREEITTPGMAIISGTGHVGMAIIPNMFTNNDILTGLQVGTGSVLATEYIQPDGTRLGRPAVVVWKINTPNVYFVSGNVGIGTSSPNSMLELSNLGGALFANPQDPAISFSTAVTSYTIGVKREGNNALKITHGRNLDKASPQFAFFDNKIGFGTSTPQSLLHVNGNSLISNGLAIATTNIQNNSLSVPKVHTKGLNIRGEVVTSSGDKWNVTRNIVYKSLLDPVGIGTSRPRADLDIVGTLMATNFIVKNNFNVLGNTQVNRIDFNQDESEFRFEVQNEKLFLDDVPLSDILSRGLPSDTSVGPIVLWVQDPDRVTDQILSETDLIWYSETPRRIGTLQTSRNINIGDRVRDTLSSFEKKVAIKVGTQNILDGIGIDAQIDHDGTLAHSKSYTLKTNKIVIDDRWSTPSTTNIQFSNHIFDIFGKSIKLTNKNNSAGPTQFTNQSSAVGVRVNVGDVKAQTSEEKVYSAIFMGDVGVNKYPASITSPEQRILDVKGVVSANRFIISKRLRISTINANDILFINESNNAIGIGVSNPNTDLDIRNEVKSTHLKADTLNSNRFSIQDKSIFVENGKVGMGTITPESLLHISKTLARTPASEFINFAITTNTQTAQKNNTGLEILLVTSTNSTFGNNSTPRTTKALDISMRNFNSDPTGEVIGIRTQTPRQSNSYAAIFKGGNVGINNPNPTYPLQVSGTIRADNVLQINLLTRQEAASFNHLTITSTTENTTIGGSTTAKDMFVRKLKQRSRSFVVNNKINLPNNSLNVTGNGLLLARNFNVSENLKTRDAQSSSLVRGNQAELQGLTVGFTTDVSGAAIIETTANARQLIAERSLNAGSATILGDTIVAQNGVVGINQQLPRTIVDIRLENDTFIPLHNRSNTVNASAGIIFTPASASSIRDIGSGIVAIKVTQNISASELIFMTDPINSLPQERMRMFNEGGIRIGDASLPGTPPRNNLWVQGSARFADITTVNRHLATNRIQNNTNIMINNSVKIFDQNFIVSQNLLTNSVALQALTTHPVTSNQKSILYTHAGTNGIYYGTILENGIFVTGNMENSFTGNPRIIPAFNNNHSMDNTDILSWTTSNIGTVKTAQFNIRSTIPNVPGLEASILTTGTVTNSILENKTLKRIELGFKDRNSGGVRTFSGYQLNTEGATAALANSEKAIGLDVDLTTLANESRRFGNNTILRGTKYAARFTGASVGIGTASPISQLHVVETTSINALVIDSLVSNTPINALTLKSNGYLGFNITPDAKVTIKVPAQDNALKIEGITQNLYVLVNKNGQIGVNQSNPSYNLDIQGTLKAKKVTSNILLGKTMEVSNRSLVVNNNSFVGINNQNPIAQLDLIKTVSTTATSSIFKLQKTAISMSGAISEDVTGISYAIASSQNTFVGNAGQSRTVTGAKFNLSNLTAESSTSKIIGIESTVSSNSRHVSAIFNGGRVGVGVTEPTVTLDINGAIKARSATFNRNSRFQATTITTNTLIGHNASLGNITVTRNRHIVISGTLQARDFIREFPFLNRTPTANPAFLIAQNVTANKLRINTSNIASNLPAIIQGTSIFTGGSLGIKDTPGVFNASANLHINAKSASQRVALLINRNAVPIFRIDRNGNVASFEVTPVGNVNPTTNLYLQSNSGPVFLAQDDISKILTVSENTQVLFGNESNSPSSIVKIKQKTAETPILRVDTSRISNALSITQAGLVGVGSSSPLASLHVSGSILVNTGATPRFHVTSTGNVGLGTTATRFNISSLENMQLTSTNVTAGNVPANISSFNGNGTLMRIANRHLFIGLLPHPTLANSFDTHIQASSSNDHFIFRGGNQTEIMRLANNQVGIGTTQPSANLHIVGNLSTTPLFVASNATQPSLVFVNSNGEISIRSTRASADIDVNGRVSARNFQNHPQGSEFTAPTLNILNERFSARNVFNITKTTSANKTHKLESILVNLGHDHREPITGVEFDINSINRLLSNGSNAYGLRVDINGLKVPDPTFQSQNAFKYAATFRGGNVGIGTLTPDDSSLKVVLTSTNANVLTSGTVVSLQGTANIIPGGTPDPGTQLNFMVNPAYTIPFAQRFAVPTESFRMVAYKLSQGQVYNGGSTFYATPEISRSVMASLKGSGILTPTGLISNSITNYQGLISALSTSYPSGFLQSYISTSNVAKVLTAYLIETSMTLRTKNLDNSVLSTPLTLYSGTNAIFPDTTSTETAIQNKAFQFGGRVLINGSPGTSTALDNNGPDNYGNRLPSFIINGDMRLGQKINKSQTEFTGLGNRLIFSGGHLINSGTTDGDNEDPIFIARENTAVNGSDLKISVGEEHTLNNAAFRVVASQPGNNLWKSALVARTFSESSNSTAAMVGIGITNPSTAFYLKGTATFNMRPDVTSNTAANITQNVSHRAMALIENKASEANSLLIKHSADVVNGVVGPNSNFITFKASDTNSVLSHLGAIEGNGETGVQLTSPEADYAEYLPRLNPNEDIAPGQIVGVFNGKVSKTTQGADQIMVTSVAPIVAGNWQGDTPENPILVAFLGQVPVKVRGKVSAGDYIIPSGFNDGTGIAISVNNITPQNSDLIIGRAWGVNSTNDTTTITVLLGLTKSPAHVVSSQKVEVLTQQITELETTIASAEAHYQSILDKQKEQIKLLKSKVKNKK
jgi:hypothetical protein